jgi:hypothetical protein
MARWLRGVAIALMLSTSVGLTGCYAEMVAPEAPPPARVVVMPARPGHIWVDGRWDWNGSTWVWFDGHYERLRHGHRWIPGHWEATPRGHRWVRGHWVRI